MFVLRYSWVTFFLLAVLCSLSVPMACSADEEQPLIDLLQSDAPKAEKALACKKLAIWGSAQAVPSLAVLLTDQELTSWARIALEAIPDQAAGLALREAIEKTDGGTLVGVINSLGVRRDEKVVDRLIVRIKDSDVGVASAAIAALGSIGNDKATAALRQALTDSPESIRSVVAEGCIRCAEMSLVNGKSDKAAKIYDEIRRADVPKQRLVEATRGAILARGTNGIPLLEQLTILRDGVSAVQKSVY